MFIWNVLLQETNLMIDVFPSLKTSKPLEPAYFIFNIESFRDYRQIKNVIKTRNML